MSDESSVSRLKSSISEYVEILSQIRGSQDNVDADSDSELSFVVRPSSEKVVEKAENLIRERVDDTSQIPYDDPRSVVRAAEEELMLVRDDLVERVEDIQRKEKESISGPDKDTMLYIVDKNAGKTGQFTILGGAESLVYNLANEENWHPIERELVYEANRIAAEENDLHRHLILDSVVIIPNDKEVL